MYAGFPSSTFLIEESGVSKVDLTAGYTSNIVPDGTISIRVKSDGACISYIDIPVSTTTTTTTMLL